MGASARLPGLLGLLVLLACCQLLQQCAAQNYTMLRNGVWLPPECPFDNVTAASELQGLLGKLPQIKGTRAEQQLQLLSASSRSKLNNLTGDAAEWLRNRTDTQLEELFESIRAENFRRMMAVASVSTQLPNVFTSSNVLRALERLQTEDLERLASLPLFDERYQRLTNVTFLELLPQLYNFGLTQVPQRTCVQTAANTSDISQLPSFTPSSNSAGATSSFSAVKTDTKTPVVTYSIMPYDGSSSMGRRLRHRHTRRSLLSALSDATLSWMHADEDEAAAAVVRSVTQDTGPVDLIGRMLLQYPVQATPIDDKTVAPIVSKFLDGLPPRAADGSSPGTTAGSGSGTTGGATASAAQGSQFPTGTAGSTGSAASGLGSSITSFGAPGVVPGVPTQTGFLDSRAVSSGLTENLGLYRLRTSQRGGTTTPRTGGAKTRNATRTARKVGRQSAPGNIVLLPGNNCSASGLVFNGTDCVPCPPNTVLEGSACVCVNGTVFNATLATCVPVDCINGTLPDGITPCPLLPPPPPCINGTLPNGTQCDQPLPPPPCINGTLPNGTMCYQPLPPPPPPCVNGTLPNGTLCEGPPGLPPPPCINGTLPNGTQCQLPPGLMPPCVNGTRPDGSPCGAAVPPPPCVNGTLPNGTLCAPPQGPPPPCVNGTFPDGSPCSSGPPLPPPPPCINGTLPDGVTPCNATLAPPQPPSPGNGTALNTTVTPPTSNGTAVPGQTDTNATAGGVTNNTGTITPGQSSTNTTAGATPGVLNQTAPPVDTNNTQVPAAPPAVHNQTASIGGGVGEVINYTTPAAPAPAPAPVSNTSVVVPGPSADTNSSTVAAPPPVTQQPPQALNSSTTPNTPSAPSVLTPPTYNNSGSTSGSSGSSGGSSSGSSGTSQGGGSTGGEVVSNTSQPLTPVTNTPPVNPAPGPTPATNQSGTGTGGGGLVGDLLDKMRNIAAPSPAPVPVPQAAPSPAPSTVVAPNIPEVTGLTPPGSPAAAVPSPALTVPPLPPTAVVPSPALTVSPPAPPPEVFSPGTYAPTPATMGSSGGSSGVAAPSPAPTSGNAGPTASQTTPAPAPTTSTTLAPAGQGVGGVPSAVNPTVAPAVVAPTPVVVTPAPPATTPTVAPAVVAPTVQPTPAVVQPTVVVPTVPTTVNPTVVAPPAVPAPPATPQVQPTAPAQVTVPTPPAPALVAPVPPVTTVVTPELGAAANKAPPVHCVGQWVESGICNGPCEGAGTKTATFTVTVPAANGGAACEAASGATKQVPCTNMACQKPTPVACVGSWAETGTCNAPCESAGTKTATFTVTVPAANGGAPCEAASGATKQVPCHNPTQCLKPVACVGSWAETGACNAACESAGTKTSVFTVTVPAANGGAACEAASGATKQVPCNNPTPCPKPPVACVGSWAETGACNAACESAGTKTSVFTITVPAANGGAACEAASGATKQVPCHNPTPCPKAPTPPPAPTPTPTPTPTPVGPPTGVKPGRP